MYASSTSRGKQTMKLRQDQPDNQRQPDMTSLINVVFLILIFFMVTVYTYGRVAGSMKGDRDVIDAMSDALASLGLYIVLVFFAAQFVAFFGWTNLGAISAVTGAEFLKESGLTGPIVFFFFIFMCALINLSLGSASAQWAVTTLLRWFSLVSRSYQVPILATFPMSTDSLLAPGLRASSRPRIGWQNMQNTG